jgi:hypothetical protein
MYEMHSRYFKTPKIRNMRRHRNKCREDFNKHQVEKKAHYEKDI